MYEPIRLGAFELREALGHGGMGSVFRAVHAREGVEVAVKVMSAEFAREPKALAAFRREVRAVASLSHPNIVSVLDHAVLPHDVRDLEGVSLVAGSPYFTMELAEATLASRPPPCSWEPVCDVLFALLDALAHAHAHGIIHRDLKPANVLWVRPSPFASPAPKLSDFGLVHAIATESEFGRAGGTPSYMAPEQFRAATRDFGPWTDLYSLGVLAYYLASGRRPFEDKDDEVLAERHRKDAPPPLVPRFPVPEGFAAWVERLLEKSPLSRFRFAADAAHALRALGEPIEGASAPARAPVDADARARDASVTFTSDAEPTETTPTIEERGAIDPFPERTFVVGEPSGLLVVDTRSTRPKSEPFARPTFDPAGHPPPPLPATWRRDTESLPAHLFGAGLGLFGIRAIPLVGRERERDLLWQTLSRIESAHRPEAVLLTGPSGFGKTGLAEWFERRVHEVGAAHTLSATHERGARGRKALVELARHHLGVRGLDWAGASQRVKQSLLVHGVTDEHERRALTDLVAMSPGDGRGGRVLPMSAEHSLLLRVLERAARDRPLVVRLEDVHFGSETLSFVEFALAESHAQLFFLLTAQDEATAADSAMKARVAAFARRERVTDVRIGPLAPADHAVLVRRMLHLGGALANDVVERTAGNPLFARELVGDWVQRGVLVLRDEGFVLRDGEHATLPDDLYEVWRTHVDASLEDADQERPVLELAALLGSRVDAGEWRDACERTGRTLEPSLVDRALAGRLLFPDDDRTVDDVSGFVFAHGMLRECLERSAEERGSAPGLHSAIADALLPRFAAGDLDVAERLAPHLTKAGRSSEALEPLRVATSVFVGRAEYERALELLALRDATIRELELATPHPARLESLLDRAEVESARGGFDAAAALAERVRDEALRHGHDELVARAASLLGHVARHLGDVERAERELVDALQRFDLLAFDTEAARALRGLAALAAMEGRVEVAFHAFLASLELCQKLDDGLGVAASKLGMGLTDESREAGNKRPVEEALDACEAHGHLAGVAGALHALGAIARREGRVPEAEALLLRALDLARGTGAAYLETAIALDLAVVFVRQGRCREAQIELSACRVRTKALRHRDLAFAVHSASILCHAKHPEERTLRYHLVAARRLLEEGVPIEREALEWLASSVLASEAFEPDDLALLEALVRDATTKASPAYATSRDLFIRG